MPPPQPLMTFRSTSTHGSNIMDDVIALNFTLKGQEEVCAVTHFFWVSGMPSSCSLSSPTMAMYTKVGDMLGSANF